MIHFTNISKKWDIYTHPWRPSPSNIQIFSWYLQTWMVVWLLGSTPEIRHLCEEKWCEVHIFDTSPEMTRLYESQTNSEYIHLCNWMEIQGYKFDMIFWDLVLHLIPLHQHNELFRSLQGNLSVSGNIMLREVFPIQQSWDFLPNITGEGKYAANMFCMEHLMYSKKKNADIEKYIDTLKDHAASEYILHDMSWYIPYYHTEIHLYRPNQDKKTVSSKKYSYFTEEINIYPAST